MQGNADASDEVIDSIDSGSWWNARDEIEWEDTSRPAFNVQRYARGVLQELSQADASQWTSDSEEEFETPRPGSAKLSSGGAGIGHLQRALRYARQPREDVSGDEAVCSSPSEERAGKESTGSASTRLSVPVAACRATPSTGPKRRRESSAIGGSTGPIQMAEKPIEDPTTPAAKHSRRTLQWARNGQTQAVACATAAVEEDQGEVAHESAAVAVEAVEAQEDSPLTSRPEPEAVPMDKMVRREELCTTPLAQGVETCRPGAQRRASNILTGSGISALIRAASEIIAEQLGRIESRVLVLVPRSNLLTWYAISERWGSGEGGEPLVRALSGNAIRSKGRLGAEAAGPPGVCFAIDAWEALAVAGPAAAALPARASRSGRKNGRPRRTADDDDSGGETVLATLAAKSPAWDLVVLDLVGVLPKATAKVNTRGKGKAQAPTAVEAKALAEAALGPAVPQQWLFLCEAAEPEVPSTRASPKEMGTTPPCMLTLGGC